LNSAHYKSILSLVFKVSALISTEGVVINTLLFFAIAILVGWLIYTHWIAPSSSLLYRYRRKPFYVQYAPHVVGVLALILLLRYALMPPSQNLVKLFEENPQTFEFHVGVGEIDTSYVSNLLKNASTDAIRDQIQEIATTEPAGETPAQPPAAPPAPDDDPAVPPPVPDQLVASEVKCIERFRCFKYKGMIIEVEKGLYEDRLGELLVGTAQAYDYVLQRSGWQFSGIVHPRYDTESGCSLNGYTYFSDHLPKVHTCNQISVESAIIIMSHEFGHQLGADNFDCYLGTDFYFSEGFATWEAGDYWLQGHKDFRSYAKALGATSIEFDIDARSDKYRVYASFVEYIIQAYGMDAFRELYGSASGANCGEPFGFDHNNYAVLGDHPEHPGQKLTQEDLFNGWRVWLAQ
jgi:hypothetical protein